MTAGLPWWQEGVIYQIYPLSFCDGNGDGFGDLLGIVSRLDHLNDGTRRSLGVDALWLGPISPSPMRDFGYDVSDYCAVSPLFGTLADLDTLVAESHRRGMRVILDLVLNHTSDEHPWFRASRSQRDHPYRDWYLWHDGAGHARWPNNWQSRFGGPAWSWDAGTRQWYMHGFLAQQPDVNWRNPQLRQAMFDVMRFWLERGIDGFRLDVVNHYVKDDRFRDNPLRPWGGILAYDRQRHVYDKDRPELIGIMQAMRALLDQYPERMAVGEVCSDDEPRASAALVGPDKLHLAFNFDFTRCPWNAAAFAGAAQQWQGLLGDEGWPCYTLSNHDVKRHASRYAAREGDEARAQVAAALLLTLRGTPFLYYGEEIGMRQTSIPRAELQDPVGKRFWPFYAGRDGCRTPMQWDGSAHAGFSTHQPWLRVNDDYVERNVTAQTSDPNSLLSFYRQLLWLRKETPALRRGTLEWLQEAPRDNLAFLRRTPEQTCLVLLSFSGRPTRLTLDRALPSRRWRVLFSNAGRNGVEQPGLSPVIAPYEVTILTPHEG